MNPDDIRKLYHREDPATRDEAAATAHDVTTNPEAARNLFQVVCAMAPTDREFQVLLRAVLDSVVVDITTNTMQADDEFALVIGRRIVTMMDAMRPAWRAGRFRKSKTA